MRTMRRRLGTLVALAAAALVFVLVVDGGSFGGAVPRPTSAASASPGTASPGTPSLGHLAPSPAPPAPSPGASAGAASSASPGAARIDNLEGIDGRVPIALPAGIEVYAGAVSITPGQQLMLHVSTVAAQYTYAIERLDATARSGGQVVARSAVRVGHDYRSLGTFDALDRTARANWPVTDTIGTAGWAPGVYVVTADDTRGTRGQAIFVVRTPVLAAGAPTFVFTALTYQAYNLWGGANLYAYAGPRGVRVSFERPYALEGGMGFWGRGDGRILRWLQLRGLALQYTTDYDLALHPPAVAPRLLILPRHAEYVTASLRDWVEQHVNTAGDMNVLDFGSNGFYWQVRLAEPRTPGAPLDIVCYRSAAGDPYAAVDPTLATTRWRESPLNRPEGMVFGAQYVAVIGNGYTRYGFTVTDQVPAELLAGTGWQPGTVIRGLLQGEGDLVYPGSGGIAIMDGRAATANGTPLATSVTIRTSPAGARVFSAGTFAWADGFDPAQVDLGVTAASFDRFNRNVLTWLGFPPGS
jgi:hypothetical protein